MLVVNNVQCCEVSGLSRYRMYHRRRTRMQSSASDIDVGRMDFCTICVTYHFNAILFYFSLFIVLFSKYKNILSCGTRYACITLITGVV